MRIRNVAMILALAVLVAAPMSLAQTVKPPEAGPEAAGPNATTTTSQGAGGKAATTQPAPQDIWQQYGPLLLMVGGFILLYYWMSRGRRKEQKKQQDMLNALKKGDRVTTIGGIKGVVVDVRTDEVVVKVDEATNTKMRFIRGAIRTVGDEASGKSGGDSSEKKS